jgi:[protein-PII] uridylyltransferase
MSQTPSFHPAVLAAREKLASGHQRMQAQHERGSPGIQVCAGLTALVDEVLLDLYRAALDELPTDSQLASQVVLVAHGGYGRRRMAPFSDVDLMLLCEPLIRDQLAPLAQLLTQFVFDAGLQLGLATRTAREAWELAGRDVEVLTSLAESRFLVGSEALFQRYLEGLRRRTLRRSRSLVASISQARKEERAGWGDTVYLLRPNVKRSRGTLRDIQLIRWVGFTLYGQPSPEQLMRQGRLSTEDCRQLREALEFLLRLRNEMHFHANRAQDELDLAEQVRIAEKFGYEGDENLFPMEQFMRQYFEHTSQVRYIGTHFLAAVGNRNRLGRILGPILRRKIGDGLWLSPLQIGANAADLPAICQDPARIMQLLETANRLNRRIDHVTWQTIRQSLPAAPASSLAPETAARFMDLLSRGAQLGTILRHLHELRVLERILPPMTHARCLLQFNEYHKYTVDEHTIRAVEVAASFSKHPGPVGEAYRGFKQKRLLHLALLMHDLGKGYKEDHSEVGRRLARETAETLPLNDWEKETLEFLVHKHLVMSHTAFRQNVNDPDTIVRFAAEVGSTDLLQALYILTCADLAAVGPGVLNAWKEELLADLYRRTRRQLTGDRGSYQSGEWAHKRRTAIRELATKQGCLADIDEMLDSVPNDLLASQAAADLLSDLLELRQAPPHGIAIWSRLVPQRNVVQYIVGSTEQNMAGIFHRLTGALSSQRNSIMGAEIHRLADSLVLDRFFVEDGDFPDGTPSIERRQQVEQAMLDVVENRDQPVPAIRPTWQPSLGPRAKDFNPLPTRVSIDNETSSDFSILTVFAYDRMGLLHEITRTLYRLELEVRVARIATYLDQVVDVFYVTDRAGLKVEDAEQVKLIRRSVQDAIDENESSDG